MGASGAEDNLPESAIVRQIVNGINEPNLKQKISNKYTNCINLFKDIDSYCKYNDFVSLAVNAQNNM